MATDMVIFDVWGGEQSLDHVARYILPINEAATLARTELANGWLVNMRCEHAFGSYANFDDRSDGEVNAPETYHTP